MLPKSKYFLNSLNGCVRSAPEADFVLINYHLAYLASVPVDFQKRIGSPSCNVLCLMDYILTFLGEPDST